MTDSQIYPLSFEQRDYLDRGHTGFGTIAACSQITGPIDVGVLTDAVRHVVARHEPLRMRLCHRDGDTGQIFADPDLVDVCWAQPPAATMQDVYWHAAEKLENNGGSPMKLKFLRLDSKRSFAMVLLDHLACDGWSSYLFLGEMWRSYRAIMAGIPLNPQPIGYKYSDYIVNQQRTAERRTSSAESALQARAERFARSDTGLRAVGPVIPGKGRADLTGEIDRAHIAQAGRLVHSLGLSPNVIPLGGAVLAGWSLRRGDSIGLSLIYAGRDSARTRPLLGLFRRYAPIITDRISEKTLADFLADLSKSVLDGIRCSRPPYLASEFEAAVDQLRGQPVVDVLYNQVDRVFGDPRPGTTRQVDTDTVTEVLDEPHFSPARWRSFSEPRLRLVLSGADRPVLRAIFNEGCVLSDSVRCLLDRTIALMGAMRADSGGRPVTEFVGSALGVGG
jgi:hypothetical protein